MLVLYVELEKLYLKSRRLRQSDHFVGKLEKGREVKVVHGKGHRNYHTIESGLNQPRPFQVSVHLTYLAADR